MDKIAASYQLNLLAEHIFNKNIEAGWYSDIRTGERISRNVPEMLCLIHSEISEALEGYRKNLKDDHLPQYSSIEVELADVLIRVFDLCGYLNLDIGNTFIDKYNYNQTRQDHKIENRLKDNGKAF